MQRTLICAVVGVVFFSDGSPLRAAEVASRTNVVFILTDDQRWDELSCAGHPFLKTPHIDRIAKEGALFRNAFVTIPLCSPSRGCFLTGQYAHKHGVTDNRDHAALSHQLVTFPRLLHDAGYETAYVGKWHMGTDDSPRPGFDRWVSFRGQGAYVDPQVNVDGQSMKMAGYITDILTDHAVEFLKRPRQKPFCLYLAHKAVHGPFTPAERHKDLYSTEPITRAPNAKDTLEGKPVLTRKLPEVEAKANAKAKAKAQAKTPGPGTGSGDGLIRSQLRCMAAIDEGVGRILQVLADTQQLDNTLLIYTSDNGYFWGEHGLGDKRAAYEESIHIPMLIRYPRLIKAGTTLEQMVLNIDIAPTALDLAGVAVPKSMHGHSIAPLFRGDTAGWRKSFLAEYFAEAMYPRIPSWQAVRSDHWKHIHYTELEGMDELYDLRADPYEMKNRINDPGARETLMMVKAELTRTVAETK